MPNGFFHNLSDSVYAMEVSEYEALWKLRSETDHLYSAAKTGDVSGSWLR